MMTTIARTLVFAQYLVVAATLLLASVEVAKAVGVSATYNSIQASTNLMSLPSVVTIFDPGTPDFGSLGLVAPGSGTSTASVAFAYPANAPNAGNPVEMYGNAVSSITNLGAGAFQVDVTLTNFTMDQGTPLTSDEYVYLNTWETFSGLGVPASLTWSTSGTISVTGNWTAGPGSSVAIEPTAIVFDPTSTTWIQSSPFFGANGTGPGGGPLVGSQAVNSLGPYVSSGQVTVGMQSILLLKDQFGTGGDLMHLPTSLHLSLTLTPVPVPEPSTLVLGALGTLVLGAVIRRSKWPNGLKP